MSRQFGLDDVFIEREPIKVTRVYEGNVTENSETFPFTMTTEETPEAGKPETIIKIEFTEGDPMNKRAAVSAIKDHF